MIDYLFIGPLGWGKNIWDKVITHLGDKECEFIEYSDREIDDINLLVLIKELEKKVSLVKSTGIIIAASFGSRFFLYCLKAMHPIIKKAILVEGFEEVPDINTIEKNFQCRQEIFSDINEYIDIMLDQEEKQDQVILDSVLGMVNKKEKQYILKCSNAMMVKYLSLLSCIGTEELLENLKSQSFTSCIYSSQKLGKMNYSKIDEKDHLLMLSSPGKIIKIL